LIAGPHAAEPAWFPDGKHLLYLYLKTQKPTLVRQPFGGVGMTFITPTAMGDADSQSHVSPKGDKIAFHTKIGESVNVCTVDADGSDFTVYVEGTSPRWHPSRNVLAFDRTVGQYSHLFLLDLGYGQVTQITTGESDNVFPVWSPDGAWICFVSDRDGKKHLYAMKADGSSLTQLTKGESQEYFPEWASDNTVYFTSDAGAPEAQSANPWKWRYADIWRLKPVLPE
jgi:TolB protein